MFCEVYEDLYIERGTYPKKTPMNEAIKLSLNGTYGNSNSEYSVFYDPKFTMTITINGQLSLCMLVEMLRREIRDFKMIQANTDGITVMYNKQDRNRLFEIVKDWENLTMLEMEHVDYSKMIVRDVNNYIAVGMDGSIKRKGAYEYEGLGWHQNHSALVIKKAAEHYLVHGGDYKEFILNHKDEYDFMLRTKVDRSSRLELERYCIFGELEEVEVLQNTCRYYPSKNGGKLVKVMPPLRQGAEERRMSIDKDWNVQPCNDMSDFSWDIDYDYYFAEVEKLIEFA